MADQSLDIDGARVKVESLEKRFPISKSVFRKATDFVHAVDVSALDAYPAFSEEICEEVRRAERDQLDALRLEYAAKGLQAEACLEEGYPAEVIALSPGSRYICTLYFLLNCFNSWQKSSNG